MRFISSSAYNMAGGTLSEKNVQKEFRISSSSLDKGVESGALTVQYRSCHGSRYRLFIRDEIVAFSHSATAELDPALQIYNHEKKRMKKELVDKQELLTRVKNELNGIDDRKISLTRKIVELETWMKENDPKMAKKRKLDN
jgi:hypothetical protein